MNTQANHVYKEPWFGIVLTVLFFPAGVFVLYRFGPWRKRTKIILATCLTLVSIGVWLIAGFMPKSDNPSVQESWLPSSQKAAKKTVSAKTSLRFDVNSDGDVTLTGTTNLPKDMKLHATVTKDDQVVGDQLIVKADGHLHSKSLKLNEKPLAPATYKVHLTQSDWTDQPKSVTDILGSKGQQLRGKEVSNHQIDLRKSVTYAP